MGDSRPDNGGGWPPEEGGGGLPEFPPEWGTVIIPDDASELDIEATAVRRELRREARTAGSGRFSLKSIRKGHLDGEPTLAVPVTIMAVAVLTTLISLFIVTLGRQAPGPTPIQTASTASVDQSAGFKTASLVDVTLHDGAGKPVRLGTTLPAIVLMLDGCTCGNLVVDVAARAPAGLHVVAVGTTAPTVPRQPANVVTLADPDATLRSRYPAGTGPAGTGATALVVNQTGDVIETITGVTEAADVPDLSRLAANHT